MKPFKFLLFCALIFKLSIQLPGQERRLDPEIVKSIEKRIEAGFNPSIAIALIDSTGTTFFNFGKAAEDGVSVDEHTIYEIGSITKTFTAILLAKQAMEGDLALDDRINDYLPEEAQVPVKGNQEITFAHLSDHTSGLPRLPGNLVPINPYNPYAYYTVEQMYEFVSTYEPVREAGAAYEYSNLAVGLLGHILALNKELSYEELVRQEILKPLGMEETSITLSDPMKENLAQGYTAKQEVTTWDLPTLAGAGALRSSTSDMAAYIAVNLGFEKSALLSSMELTHQKRHQKGGVGVGLAWHISDGSKGDIIWHNGGTGGYRTFSGFVKETGQGAVVLTNSTESVDDIGFRLLDPDYNLRTILSEEDAIEVDEDVLTRYEGVYELMPNFMITISQEEQKLFAQATGQQQFELFAENDTTFFLTVIQAKITFQEEADTIKSLTLFQGNQVLKGLKME